MPTGSDPRLKTSARKRVLAQWRALAPPDCQHPHCRWPGVPIDYTAPRHQRLALEVDEIIPRYLGGDPTELANTRPTHAGCNRSAGTRITNQIRRTRGRGNGRQPPTTNIEPITSRDWW